MTFSSVRTALQRNGKFYFEKASIRLRTKEGCRSSSTIMRNRERNNPRAVLLYRRSMSTTIKSDASSSSTSDTRQERQRRCLIPTRHSSKGPPPVCRDVAELQDLTNELLESAVGSLFCQGTVKASNSPGDDRDEAYALAQKSGDQVEYILRGYNRIISPLTLCGSNTTASAERSDLDEVSASLETMMDVMERFHQEGEMYLQLRREALDYSAATSSDEIRNDSSSNSSSSSSSSSDESSSSENAHFIPKPDDHEDADERFSSLVKDKLDVDAREQADQQQLSARDDDFALPGVTTAMYDIILDAMACAAHVSLETESTDQNTSNSLDSSSFLQMLVPEDVYRVAGAAWKAHDLNNQHNSDDFFFSPTTPTMITYNASLRGIGNICMSSAFNEEQKAMVIDQSLGYGFAVYNHLTHNDHGLSKRNAASIIYLLKIIQACIPPSRTRGNMTVALWHQASREGLVTPTLIKTIVELHEPGNGPEFDVFLESIEKCVSSTGGESNKAVITPQRFARFAKKFSTSQFY